VPDCAIADCSRPVKVRGWCRSHYRSARRREVVETRPCVIEGCEAKRVARGWCASHYTRWKRHGDPLGGRERYGQKDCVRPGCARVHHARGLCATHYGQQWKGEEPCKEEGCSRVRVARGWCAAHYQRWRKYGAPYGGATPLRRERGTALPSWFYDEARRGREAPDQATIQWVSLLRADPCSYCDGSCEAIDHIVPFSQQGATHWTNLTAACAGCNGHKNAVSLTRFLLNG
jgi:hypothetical protein